MKKTALRRMTAGVGALAIALVGLGAASTAANAAVGPDQDNAPTSGTLTINKYSGAPIGEDGTLDTEKLLDGVEFTVTQVGRTVEGNCVAINLTQAAAWTGLEDLFASAPAAPAAPFCLTSTVQDDVTVDGQVDFDLAVGIYYVSETDPGDNNIVSPVPPFYVSIPTSNGEDGDGWNYNVVADPKNQLMDEPSKTINTAQEDLVIGDEVEWTITVPIPTLNNDETFTEAVIRDTLDSRLTLVPGSSVVEIDEGATTNFSVAGNAVWTFNEDGLEELDAAMGGEITITFKTTVNSVGDGAVPNDDYDSTFNGTTVPGEVVPYTYWGQLAILKVDDSEQQLPLEGAEFVVFPASATDTCEAVAPTGTPTATGTSDDNGVVQWEDVDPADVLGLWIANVNDGPADPTPKKVYCVYETVAPAGHTLVPAGQAVTIAVGEDNINEITVTNPKKDGPDLPLTGAQGTLLMTVAGLMLVSIGAGAIVLARRRRVSADV